MNISPFLNAVDTLRELALQSGSMVAAGPFCEAAYRFTDTLNSNYIPEIPNQIRDEVNTHVRDFSRSVGSVREIPKGVATRFLLEIRKKWGLIPESSMTRDQIMEYFRTLASRQAPSPGDIIEHGGNTLSDPHAKHTMRGEDAVILGGRAVYVDAPQAPAVEDLPPPTVAEPIPAEPTSQEQAVRRELLNALKHGSFPLVDRDGYLSVEGEVRLPKGFLADTDTADAFIRSVYQLGQEIGSGGTSRVYLCKEAKTDRLVAIKIVLSSNAKERTLIFNGYDRELDAQKHLTSDRFVRVFAVGKTSDGSPFIVMEYFKGGSLSDYIQKAERREFDIDQTVSLARQMVAAVAELHEKGIIHRDIKPDNFFRTEDDKIKLGDFGVRLHKADVAQEKLGAMLGTLWYIPPENLGWNTPLLPPSEKADVFALGVSLYELFTGQDPFDGDSAVDRIKSTCEKTPTPPTLLRPDRQIPSGIERVILKAMDKDPARRYQNAQEMLDELVMYRARTLEDQAAEAQRMSVHPTMADYQIHQKTWRAKLQEALRELRSVADEIPSETVRKKRIELNYRLFLDARHRGDIDMMERTRESLLALDAGSDESLDALRQVEIDFALDDGGDPNLAEGLRLDVMASAYSAGYFEPIGRMDRGRETAPSHLSLDIIGSHNLVVTGPYITEVNIPRPARAGDHTLRIPLYPKGTLPTDWILVPAGPAAARQRPGSFAEEFDNWRFVDYDFGVSPLQTGHQWNEFLGMIQKEQGQGAAVQRLPKNWYYNQNLERFLYRDSDLEVDFDRPVTHVPYPVAIEYLEFMSRQMNRPVRLIRLPEWQRTMRGNDARQFSWGDAPPDAGIVGFRFPDPRAAGELMVLPNDAPGLRDISPFSVPNSRRQVTHLVGNVQKLIDLSDAGDRERIAKAFRKDPKDFGTNLYIATSGSYQDGAPLSPDILKMYSMEDVIPSGILLVTPLDSAQPTPTLESVRPPQRS